MPRLFSDAEIDPPATNPEPTVRGIVIRRDATRAAEHIYTYDVEIEHPQSHSTDILYGVQERADVFYKNQAGQINVNQAVWVTRGRDGRWEIAKSELQSTRGEDPLFLAFGPQNRPSGYFQGAGGDSSWVQGPVPRDIISPALQFLGSAIGGVSRIEQGQGQVRLRGDSGLTLGLETRLLGTLNQLLHLYQDGNIDWDNRPSELLAWNTDDNNLWDTRAAGYSANAKREFELLPVIAVPSNAKYPTGRMKNTVSIQNNELLNIGDTAEEFEITHLVLWPARLVPHAVVENNLVTAAGKLTVPGAAARSWGPVQVGEMRVYSTGGVARDNTPGSVLIRAPADTNLPRGWTASDYDDLTYEISNSVLDISGADLRRANTVGIEVVSNARPWAGQSVEVWEATHTDNTTPQSLPISASRFDVHRSLTYFPVIEVPPRAVIGVGGYRGFNDITCATAQTIDWVPGDPDGNILEQRDQLVMTPFTDTSQTLSQSVFDLAFPPGVSLRELDGQPLNRASLNIAQIQDLTVLVTRITPIHPTYGRGTPVYAYFASADAIPDLRYVRAS